jgi:hypothetical protein
MTGRTDGDRAGDRTENRPENRTGDRADAVLAELAAAPLAPPPLCAELEAALAELPPVRPRRPLRGFVVLGLASLLFGGGLLWLVDVRPDLSGLPRAWMVLYSLAWLAGFLAIAWLALVPRPAEVMPGWRRAGVGAVVASIGFVLAGLLFHRQAPGKSIVGESTWSGLTDYGLGCLLMGVVTALVPVALGALILRGSVPVGSRWAGAGLGAAGGSLGGLFLHLHCHVADALHLGVIHGGVVVAGAIVGALIIPRAARS